MGDTPQQVSAILFGDDEATPAPKIKIEEGAQQTPAPVPTQIRPQPAPAIQAGYPGRPYLPPTAPTPQALQGKIANQKKKLIRNIFNLN